MKLFYFEHPHPLQRYSGVGQLRDTRGPGTLCGWALQGDSGVGHSREILGLGTPGIGMSEE